MQIEIKLYATLRRYLPGVKAGQPYQLTLPEGATVAATLTALGVPEDDSKQAFVNDVAVEMDCVLHQGDRVGLFPPVGGG